MINKVSAFFAIIAVIFLSSYVNSKELDKNALGLVSQTAKNICGTFSKGGRASDFHISGEAESELNGLLKKLTDSGFKVNAHFNSSEYVNVKREELASELTSLRKCNLEIWRDLKELVFADNKNNYHIAVSQLIDVCKSIKNCEEDFKLNGININGLHNKAINKEISQLDFLKTIFVKKNARASAFESARLLGGCWKHYNKSGAKIFKSKVEFSKSELGSDARFQFFSEAIKLGWIPVFKKIYIKTHLTGTSCGRSTSASAETIDYPVSIINRISNPQINKTAALKYNRLKLGQKPARLILNHTKRSENLEYKLELAVDESSQLKSIPLINNVNLSAYVEEHSSDTRATISVDVEIILLPPIGSI